MRRLGSRPAWRWAAPSRRSATGPLPAGERLNPAATTRRRRGKADTNEALRSVIQLYRRLRASSFARSLFFSLVRSYERHWDALALSGSLGREVTWGVGDDERAFWESGRVDAETHVLPFVSGETAVLDLGCGVGRVARWVAPACRELVLADVSGRMLSAARKNLRAYRNVRYVKTDGRSLPGIESETVDVAYSFLVLHQLEREDALLYLVELNRVLRPGGLVIFQVANLANAERARDYLADSLSRGPRAISRARYYTEEEIRLVTGLAGFAVEDLKKNGSLHVRVRRSSEPLTLPPPSQRTRSWRPGI